MNKQLGYGLVFVMIILSSCGQKNKEPEFPNSVNRDVWLSESTSAAPEEQTEVESLSEQEFKESLGAMAETLGEGYSLAAVENESGGVDYKFVPTVFPVYQDGESHHLMYGANANTYMYAPFTNISIPEYRIASISLPTQMIQPERGRQVITIEDQLTSAEMEKDVLYETSSRYSIDGVDVYSIEASSFIFRTWAVPYAGAPDVVNIDIMHDLYTTRDKMYGLDQDMWNVRQLDNGAYQYSTMCFLRDYIDNSAQNAYAMYTIIIHDGTAYCYLAGGYSPANAFWLAEYVLKHSFRFE